MPKTEEGLQGIIRSKRKMQILKHLKKAGSDYNQNMALRFDVSPGSFFTHIERLEKYGLIESFMKDNKKDVHYKLTELGEKTLSEQGE
jgi:predicted transcriptional regulator